MPHELIAAIHAGAGLVLNPRLVEMMDEHPSHRTERRGCGYTQATRFLAGLISQAVANRHLARDLFDPRERSTASRLADGTALDALQSCRAALRHPESLLLLDLIIDLVRADHTLPNDLEPCLEKPKVGSCPLAEQYFLEVAHGRLRRGGRIQIWCDAIGRACLLEKRGMGDDRSSISLRSLHHQGVTLPSGSLIALDYDDRELGLSGASPGWYPYGLPISATRGRFLRLTTLAVAPEDRPRAFTSHFAQQVANHLFSPDTTTLDMLCARANIVLGGARR